MATSQQLSHSYSHFLQMPLGSTVLKNILGNRFFFLGCQTILHIIQSLVGDQNHLLFKGSPFFLPVSAGLYIILTSYCKSSKKNARHGWYGWSQSIYWKKKSGTIVLYYPFSFLRCSFNTSTFLVVFLRWWAHSQRKYWISAPHYFIFWICLKGATEALLIVQKCLRLVLCFALQHASFPNLFIYFKWQE